ncbi:hypothetical protein Taro_053754, partial [Colocasia esculenta]|nr:hypothetical protein [Colocasia esculenta]
MAAEGRLAPSPSSNEGRAPAETTLMVAFFFKRIFSGPFSGTRVKVPPCGRYRSTNPHSRGDPDNSSDVLALVHHVSHDRDLFGEILIHLLISPSFQLRSGCKKGEVIRTQLLN